MQAGLFFKNIRGEMISVFIGSKQQSDIRGKREGAYQYEAAKNGDRLWTGICDKTEEQVQTPQI